jgi:hypothetical protein
MSSNNNVNFQKCFAKDLPENARLDPSLGLDACPWLDRYIEFSQTWSSRSYEGYHEAIGLWLLSTIAARRVAIVFGKTRYTNLSILLVGRTTLYAKTTAVEIGKELLQRIGLDYLLLPDDSTPQAMIKEMAGKLPENYDKLSVDQKEHIKRSVKFSGQRGWFCDEFGGNIQLMMRKDGPYADLRSMLRKFDDTELNYEKATITRDKERIDRPYLALIGSITIADLAPFSCKGSGLWRDGFFARMGFIVPPEGLIKDGEFPRGARNIPDDLSRPLVDWNKRLGAPDTKIIDSALVDGSPHPCTLLNLSEEVRHAYYAYDKALREMLLDLNTQDLDGNYGRLPEKALRIAGLFASLGNCSTINMNHWVRAQQIVERWRRNLHELYNQVNEENLMKPKLTSLQKVRKAFIEKEEPTEREIVQYTGLSYDEVAQLLKQLEKEGKIIPQKAGKTIRYRRTNKVANQEHL